MARSELDRSVELSMDAVDVLAESMRHAARVGCGGGGDAFRASSKRATMIEAQRRYERGSQCPRSTSGATVADLRGEHESE